MKILVVIDMQNDFIDGVLGTPEAVEIVPKVVKKTEEFEGEVVFTRDTHGSDYLNTQEGSKLPVPHCVKGTHGWELRAELDALRKTEPIDKHSFGLCELGNILCERYGKENIESITIVGLCTDICVISNAMIMKASLPEVPIYVDSSCCAGVTPASHETALRAMEACQINVI